MAPNLNPKQTAPLKQLQTGWSEAGKLRLHYRFDDASGGLPVVLIHGLVISSLYMVPLACVLRRQQTVFALDLPGFGRSSGCNRALSIPELAAAVVEWLENMQIGRCHLVANSLGCQVAAHVAVKAPERIASTVLIGATMDPAARRLLVQVARLALDAIREPPSLWPRWLFDFCRCGVPRALGTVRHMFADRIEEQLPAIAAPTLIVRGEHDPTMPQRWAEEAAAMLQHGSLEVIADEHHCAHYSAPEPVAKVIQQHVNAAVQQ
jgi:pimeloyl-ACP methyl ester carboxylesterase